jgi:hypothetical protein
MRKLVRLTALGGVLLLANASNLLFVSVDNDGNEETAPITVEMSVAVPSARAAHVQKSTARRTLAAGLRRKKSGAVMNASRQRPPLNVNPESESARGHIPIRC